MALIHCPNCDKEISDKAATCPGCGYDLSQYHKPEESASAVCEECGAKMLNGATVCPQCGCPVSAKPEDAPQKVEVTGVKLPKLKSKSKKLIAIAAIAVVLLVAGAFLIVKIQNDKALNDYSKNLKSVSADMLSGASDAETAGNLIKSVWYNTIYEKSDMDTNKYTRNNNGRGNYNDDFNDSLRALFADPSFETDIQSIKDNQSTVGTIMKKLKNPPEKFKEAYDALKEYYNAYLSLTNLAIDPSGSLQTFSNGFNSADTNVFNCYKAFKLYID